MKTRLTLTLVMFVSVVLRSAQTDINGPSGSGAFGTTLKVLPNGNFVVTDPGYDVPSGPANVGAVYLYDSNGVLLSTLTGSTASDAVGNAGVTVLANGNFVVRSSLWANGAATSAGAVTWGSATSGFGAVAQVSASNSLVGSSTSDRIGNAGIFALPNGHYVVCSSTWDNTTPTTVGDVGAVTWCDGTTGAVGLVSASNSLVGVSSGDNVGSFGIVVVGGNNYVVMSPAWRNLSPSAFSAGAVTWANGSTGITGAVTSANSLVGATSNDAVGTAVVVLSTGHYVVSSPNWNRPSPFTLRAGAATWCDGSVGTAGVVTTSNSLHGSSVDDHVGEAVTALTNGHYVVCSSLWDDGSAFDAGAATWCNGNGSTVGAVSSSNSLVGSTSNNLVGARGAKALTNGNYVVRSPFWDNGATSNVGAATWGNGSTGITGAVSTSNSLYGTTAEDGVSNGNTGVLALTNGNYVVISDRWDRVTPAVVDVGAATWCNGATGRSGPVTESNSLFGGTADDTVGIYGNVYALPNGNYVVCSNNWNKPSPLATNAGAVTWGSGTTGVTGLVSSSNSLVGGQTDDAVGAVFTVLSNGNYVVGSPDWDNPSPVVVNAGAATWCSGTTGRSGVVSASNSLICDKPGDHCGGAICALTNGHYVVTSSQWGNPVTNKAEAGAATWANGTTGLTGVVTVNNSLVGVSLNDSVGYAQPLSDGNYVLINTDWQDLPFFPNGGAITLCSGGSASIGVVHSGNSVFGKSQGNASNMIYGYVPAGEKLVVAQRNVNRVSVFTVSPEIVVEAPAGQNRNDNIGGLNLGSVATGGSSAPLVFVVKNIGTVPLHLSAINITGTNASDFVKDITGMSSTVAPGTSTTFSITFSPGAVGARNAALSIVNDDTTENPFEQTLSGTGTLSPGSLAFSSAGFTVDEDDGNATIPITRTGGSFGEVRVKVATSNGTATAPSDFTALAPTYEVVFPDGVTTANALISIINNASSEANESFTLTLSAPTNGATLGAATTASVTIIDLSAYSNVTDTINPGAPVILSPAADARVGINTGGTTTLSGTAGDNKGVQKVSVSLNGASFQDAVLAKPGAPSTPWSFPCTPLTGLNTFQVQSTDYAGRTSTIITRSFVVTRPLPIVLNVAQGSITAGFAPTSFREVGKLVSLTATPKPGYLFWRWVVNSSANNGQAIGVTNDDLEQPKLSFIFKEGTTLQADFVATFYAGEANNGNFAGAVQPSTTLPDRAPLGLGSEDGTASDISTEGLFTATVSKTGSFTGKLTIDGLVLNVSGSFDATGEARFGSSRSRVLSVARTGKPSLALALQLFNNTRTITGTVAQFGPFEVLTISTISAPQAYYSLPANVLDTAYLTVAGSSKKSGVFNARLAALGLGSQPAGYTKADYPQGDGPAVITLTPTGAVTAACTLADGTVFTAASTLSQTLTFRLFAQLYSKRGFVAGNVSFDKNAATTDLSATNVLWFRPSQDTQHYSRGWQNVKVDLLGAKYSMVAGTSALTGLTTTDTSDLTFSAGKLGSSITDNFTISNADAVTNLNVGNTLVITRSSGKFSGVFVHSDGTKLGYQGILLQKGSARGGYGFFLTTTPKVKDYTGQSGGVLITP